MANDIEQRQRIVKELNKNLLVAASAGSGKTAMLVERLVALVEKGEVSLNKIAALTFTKKAAGEFYDRFYKKLKLRTRPDFELKRHDEYSLLGNPSKEAVERDKEALSHIDTCFFGTIDSFYQKILNEHPLEVGLSSDATIFEDEQIQTYLLVKFGEYLRSDNPKIREGAEFFARNVGADSFPEIMNNIISHHELDLYQIIGKVEDFEKNYLSLIDDFKAGCKVLISNEGLFRPRKDDGSDVTKPNGEKWDYLLDEARHISSFDPKEYKTANKIFKKLEELRFNDDERGLLAKYNFITNFAVEWTNGKSKKHMGFEIKSSVYHSVLQIIYHNAIEFLSLVKDDVYESMINDGVLTFSIATDLLLKFLRDDKYKSTLNQIRSKIDCLLIDECQDTDIKQYEIFFRLTASNYDDDFRNLKIEGGKLYACGDRKQGIYHFRGADVKTYDEIKEIFVNRSAKGFPYDLVVLSDNHRSKGPLKQYFNDTFSNILGPQGYEKISNDEIKLDETEYGTFNYHTDKHGDPTCAANLILQLHVEKKYPFKDFMVITSNKDNILDYSKAFAEFSIPSYSEGNIDLHISPLLDVSIALLKYYGSNKKDLISYFEILTSPLFGFDASKTIDINQDYFSTLNLNGEKPYWPSDLLERFVSNKIIIQALNCRGIDVLIGLIHLLKGEENNGNIANYDDAIKYFEKLQGEDNTIERLSLLANNIDAVQIANAHKTKGLEKKVVILTKAGNNNNPPDKIVDDKYYIITHQKGPKDRKYNVLENPDKDSALLKDVIDKEKQYGTEENLRLLYVAATRAREYLYISNPEYKPTTSKWYRLLVPGKADTPIKDTYKADTKLVKYVDEEINAIVNNKKQYEIVSPSTIDNSFKQLDEEREYSSLKRDDALVFGTMVHKLLEYIVNAKEVVLDDSICDAIAKSYDAIKFRDDLLKVKQTIYSGGYKQKTCPFDDLLAEAKQCECFTETPFSYKEGNKIINGFIDLILESDNEILIVDYKTDSSDIDHQKQLDCYKAIVQKNNPKNKAVKTYIYLINKS